MDANSPRVKHCYYCSCLCFPLLPLGCTDELILKHFCKAISRFWHRTCQSTIICKHDLSSFPFRCTSWVCMSPCIKFTMQACTLMHTCTHLLNSIDKICIRPFQRHVNPTRKHTYSQSHLISMFLHGKYLLGQLQDYPGEIARLLPD